MEIFCECNWFGAEYVPLTFIYDFIFHEFHKVDAVDGVLIKFSVS
jgi:hypothetical protein